jgi:hypothetical protein
MGWKAVRFLRVPLDKEIPYVLSLWEREYEGYAARNSMRVDLWPEVNRFIHAAKHLQLQYTARHEERFFGLPAIAVSNVKRSGEETSIELSLSHVPRLVWRADDLRRKTIPPEPFRALLRSDNVDILASDRKQCVIGRYRSALIWYAFDNAGVLNEKPTESLEFYCLRVAKWLEMATAASSVNGSERTVFVKGKRGRLGFLAANQANVPTCELP